MEVISGDAVNCHEFLLKCSLRFVVKVDSMYIIFDHCPSVVSTFLLMLVVYIVPHFESSSEVYMEKRFRVKNFMSQHNKSLGYELLIRMSDIQTDVFFRVSERPVASPLYRYLMFNAETFSFHKYADLCTANFIFPWRFIIN